MDLEASYSGRFVPRCDGLLPSLRLPERLRVERCEDAAAYMEDWSRLYEHLIRRHGITGIRAFSHHAFATQFKVPGLVAFRALYQGTTVAMALAYVRDNVAYIHLSACDPVGDKTDASSALYWRLIEHCRDRGLKWLNLGAGAGANGDGNDGLTRFKRGWSTGTRTVYFCGRIFNRPAYDRIVKSKGLQDSVYFPAYQAGEFG